MPNGVLPTSWFVRFRREYEAACAKHPLFPTPGKHPLQIVMEELGEACRAFNDGDFAHGEQELDQCMVTIRRWQEMENKNVPM